MLTLNNLAYLLATTKKDALRNGKRALQLAEQAVELQPDALTLGTLAAAQAECKQYSKAAATVDCAIALLPTDSPDRAELEKQKKLYKANKPVRE